VYCFISACFIIFNFILLNIAKYVLVLRCILQFNCVLTRASSKWWIRNPECKPGFGTFGLENILKSFVNKNDNQYIRIQGQSNEKLSSFFLYWTKFDLRTFGAAVYFPELKGQASIKNIRYSYNEPDIPYKQEPTVLFQRHEPSSIFWYVKFYRFAFKYLSRSFLVQFRSLIFYWIIFWLVTLAYNFI